MIEALFRPLVGGAVLTIAFAMLASAGVKYFARPLPYSKAFLISLAGFAVSTILLLVYFFAKAALAWSDTVDSIFTIIAMCVAGAVITRLARNYGIKKTGWLGIGAKSILVLVVLSWLIIAVVYFGIKLLS